MYAVDFLGTGERKESNDLTMIKTAIRIALQLEENSPEEIIVYGVERSKVVLK